jgi:hypothetical protein
MTPADRAEIDLMLEDIKRGQERAERFAKEPRTNIPELAFLLGWFRRGVGDDKPGAYRGEVDGFAKALGRVR